MGVKIAKLVMVFLSFVILAAAMGYAQVPPSTLSADGYFDDHLNLYWLAPGYRIVSHYEGPMDSAHYTVDGYAFAIAVDPNAIGAYRLLAISFYIISEGDPGWPWPNAIHEPIIVKAWADNAGQPGAEIYSLQDQHSGIGSWLVHEIVGTVNASGTIYVGNVQMGQHPNVEGMGVDLDVNFPELNWESNSGGWVNDPTIFGDLMFEALVYGDFGGGPEARWVGPSEYSSMQRDFPANDGTDDLLYYRIYRDGTLYDSTATVVETYDDYEVVEGTEYRYTVSAMYDPEGESEQTDPAYGAANMPPGAPTDISAITNWVDTITLTWTDPVLNEDGTPCVDLAWLNVYRDSVFLTQLAPGVQTYVDLPPEPRNLYTWSVTALDEVPNEGPAAQITTSVFTRFEEIPYDWIEINPSHPGALPGINTGIWFDDQNFGPFSLGFTFPFYGNDFDSIRVCSNGFASFTSTSNTYGNVSIPNAYEPNNLVAPYFDDMNLTQPSGYGSIWYYADPGGEFFVVEWDSMAHYNEVTGPDGVFTFEVILWGPNHPHLFSTIDFMYKEITPGLSAFPSASVGKENATGTRGVQVTYDGSGPIEPETGMGIRVYGDSISVVGVEDFIPAPAVPQGFAVYSPYPNPFNSTTTIRFDLPAASRVKLEVFDIHGRRVGVACPFGGLAPTRQYLSGHHQITFDGSNLPSGIYIYRLAAGNFTASGKMVLLK